MLTKFKVRVTELMTFGVKRGPLKHLVQPSHFTDQRGRVPQSPGSITPPAMFFPSHFLLEYNPSADGHSISPGSCFSAEILLFICFITISNHKWALLEPQNLPCFSVLPSPQEGLWAERPQCKDWGWAGPGHPAAEEAQRAPGKVWDAQSGH